MLKVILLIISIPVCCFITMVASAEDEAKDIYPMTPEPGLESPIGPRKTGEGSSAEGLEE